VLKIRECEIHSVVHFSNIYLCFFILSKHSQHGQKAPLLYQTVEIAKQLNLVDIYCSFTT